MSAEYIALSYGQLALAASLVVVCGAVSLALRLRLEGRLALGVLRTIVQLLLLGLVLRWVFAAGQWHHAVALMIVMTIVAGVAAVRRVERRYAGLLLDSILAIWVSTWCVAAVGIFGVVQVPVDRLAQYGIPLLGMVLHNTLTGMMTGQLLAGVDPLQAAMYQMVIMFLIATGASLGAMAVGLMGYRRLFTADHQFLPARLTQRNRSM